MKKIIDSLKGEPWAPIKDCSYIDPEDKSCGYDAHTPECHIFCCPRLHSTIYDLATEALD